MNIRHCEDCGRELTKRSQKRFCSKSCSASTNNRKRGITTIDCIQCGTSVVPKQPSQKYCSNKCQKLYEMFHAIQNNTASHKTIKKYLIHLHGERCLNPDCLWDFNKTPVVVELEHRDGDSNNNTMKNCTLLCPNCHSLTPTYKSKNRGNGRHYRRTRYANGQSF